MPFSKLGLSTSLSAPLARLGYTEPTRVQAEAIPLVLKGADVLARAQTGTGKTAAFGLPMIDRLFVRATKPGSRTPRGLVLVPTRELAQQVQKSLANYGAPTRVRVAAIFGGVSMGRQIDALRRGTDIIVATPGRLIDHLERRTVDLSGIEILVLDEADRMLDMGFMPALKRVIPALPRARQTLLFSATLDKAVVDLSAQFTRDPLRVDVSDGQTVAATVTHQLHPVALERKRELLTHVLTEASGGQTLVFCKTKRGSDRVCDHLESAGIKAAVIHGNKSQNARTRALGDFKAGRVSVLVATDIAARGLDIAQLPLVVNYDMPLVAEDYVHRVGRTGRAGRAGRAVSLVSASEKPLVRDIERLLSAPLERVVIAAFDPPAGHDVARARPDTRQQRPARREFRAPWQSRPRHAPGGPRRAPAARREPSW